MAENEDAVKNIGDVVKAGLCCGCGTCQALCPKNAVTLSESKEAGVYVPAIDQYNCSNCGICKDVCPGREVDFLELERAAFGRSPTNNLLGARLGCYSGYSSDQKVRYSSASGGMVTSLLLFALREKLIDGALVVKAGEGDPLRPFSFIARTEEEIIASHASRYCPVPVNLSLKEILKNEGRYAVVGLPCHIAGVRMAEQMNKKLKEKIKYHFCLVCNHTPTFRATDFLLKKLKVEPKEIREVSYRGQGWPGGCLVKCRNQKEYFIKLGSFYYWGLIFQKLFWPRRCFLCNDKIGRLGDISFMDPHLPEYYQNEKIGASLMITRSSIADELLAEAMHAGVIETSLIEEEKIITAQSLSEIIRRNAARRRLFLAFKQKVPSYNGTVDGEMQFGQLALASFDFLLVWLSERSYFPANVICGLYNLYKFLYKRHKD